MGAHESLEIVPTTDVPQLALVSHEVDPSAFEHPSPLDYDDPGTADRRLSIVTSEYCESRFQGEGK